MRVRWFYVLILFVPAFLWGADEPSYLPLKSILFLSDDDGRPPVRNIQVQFNSELKPFPTNSKQMNRRGAAPPFRVAVTTDADVDHSLEVEDFRIQIDHGPSHHRVKIEITT